MVGWTRKIAAQRQEKAATKMNCDKNLDTTDTRPFGNKAIPCVSWEWRGFGWRRQALTRIHTQTHPDSPLHAILLKCNQTGLFYPQLKQCSLWEAPHWLRFSWAGTFPTENTNCSTGKPRKSQHNIPTLPFLCVHEQNSCWIQESWNNKQHALFLVVCKHTFRSWTGDQDWQFPAAEQVDGTTVDPLKPLVASLDPLTHTDQKLKQDKQTRKWEWSPNRALCLES